MSIPVVTTWAGVVAVLGIVVFRILTDRSASQVQQDQIDALRRQQTEDAERHASEMTRLEARCAADAKEHAVALAHLEGKFDAALAENVEQRSMKHHMAGELAKARLTLDLVRHHARNCTCDALGSLADILDRLAETGDI